MKKTKISQGPWTRIRPLHRDEIGRYTKAGMVEGELTWGRFRNSLCKEMAYHLGLMQTEVPYCNTKCRIATPSYLTRPPSAVTYN